LELEVVVVVTRRFMALVAVVVVVGVSACSDDSSTADLERSSPTSTADTVAQAPQVSAPAAGPEHLSDDRS
jgi:hypothetical protein